MGPNKAGTKDMTEGSRRPARIAYLLSQYPAVSHTFFLGEIVMMRDRGFLIETASVNSIHPPPDGFPPLESREAENTFYIKQTPKLEILKVLAKAFFTRPAVIARGLGAALQLTPWDLRGMTLALFYLLEAILLGDWMRRKGCTHLHVHFSGPVATVAMLTSMAWKIPYSMTVHGPDEFFNISRFFLKEKIARAQFVTCISFFARSQLLRISPPEMWDKFYVCRLGVQTKTFAPVVREPSDILHIISVGRLHPSKGQIFLLRAFRELKNRGFPIRLSIVGGGDEAASLQRFISDNGMSDSVTLRGALSHSATRQLLGTADLFVLSSFAEGVPVALMEAMAMEIACVGTFVAGTAELVEHGKEGLLVAPSSEEALIEAMAALLSDPERRARMAHGGRQKVLACYDISKNIDRLVAVFEQYGLAGKSI
ncbi:MAG TPA: glycosyltransferase family 4 protein [Acidisarcina sp.]